MAAIYSDCRKAKKMLGWVPRFFIQEAMQSAWQWHLNLVNNKHPKRPLK
jgi:UDP-glucose 4-epimerase